MKTITYPEDIYKLVPIDLMQKISHALHCADVLVDAVPTRAQASEDGQLANLGKLVNEQGVYQTIANTKKDLFAYLSVIPTDLSGVVEHSGEPIYWLEAEESARNADPRDIFGKYSMLYSTRLSAKEPDGNNPRWPLFTHPPAQPDTAALQARIAELEGKIKELDAALYESEEVRGTLKTRFAAQAGQEPPIAHLQMWHTEDVDGRDDGFDVCSESAEGAIPVYTAPANSLDIVQAAMEAAANFCSDLQLPNPDKDTVIDNYNRGCKMNALGILAINPQSILDGMSKKGGVA